MERFDWHYVECGTTQRILLCLQATTHCPNSGLPIQLGVGDGLEIPSDMSLICPEFMASAGFARVSAMHYPDKQFAAGTCGPVSLEHIVSFSREIQQLARAGQKLAIYSSDCKWASGNTLLLLGAYLILEHGMTAQQVMAQLPVQSRQVCFPTPWSPNTNASLHEHSLSLADCFEGLEAANKYGWLDYKSFSVESWRHTLKTYDACLCMRSPFKEQNGMLNIWAMADPVTTVADPSVRPLPPQEGFTGDYEAMASGPSRAGPSGRRWSEVQPTSPKIPAKSATEWERAISAEAATSPPRSPSAAVAADPPENFDKMRSESGGSEQTWLHSERVRTWAQEQHKSQSQLPFAFVKERGLVTMPEVASWLQSSQCRVLLRLNYPDEKNLPAGNSYDNYFDSWVVEQKSLMFGDCTAPHQGIVKGFADLIKDLTGSSAMASEASLAVHCTAGLGRTMTLLGSFAVQQFSISGGAWLGWARMCRPGSVQTRDQERFLKNLKPANRSQYQGCCTVS